MSFADFTISPATDAIGAQIASLISNIFKDYENCPFLEEEFHELKAVGNHYRSMGGEIWVAQSPDDQVLGCLAVVPTMVEGTFEIFKVYVCRQARGTGLAQALYDTGLHWSQQRGLRSFRLWADTRFLSGHRFYEKLGFTKQPVIRYLGDAAQSWEFLFLCAAPEPLSKAHLEHQHSQ